LYSLTAAAAASGPFRRTGSYSSKIRATGHFGIAAGTAVRNSWAQLTETERRGSQDSLTSPKPSPKPSPTSWRKQQVRLKEKFNNPKVHYSKGSFNRKDQ
jgi:hypothetical protein